MCSLGVGDEGGLLSDVEIVLPSEIIESLGSLKPESLSCFMSVDEKTQTTKQLFIHKLIDNSVRIRVTVMVLGSCNEKSSVDKGIEDGCTEMSALPLLTAATDSSGIVPGIRRQRETSKRTLKPCIATAIHTNKLNKKLTSIWQSRRKKLLKKILFRSTAVPVRQKNPKLMNSTNKLGTAVATQITRNTAATGSGLGDGDGSADDARSVMNRIESIDTGATLIINATSIGKGTSADPQDPSNDDEFFGFDLMPGSSTVIILKTVVTPPRVTKATVTDGAQTGTSAGLDRRLTSNEPRLPAPRLDERPDAEMPKVTSRDIAERLKARERKGAPPQVSCELCGEVAESYVSLYRHIKRQHADCTFVRNYLEEIEPLACTPCPICKKPFTTPTSLSAHISNAHPDKKKPSRPQPSKLTAQRHHIAAEKKRAQTPSDDSSDGEDADDGPFACKVCGKQVEDDAKYRRHMLTHGEFRFPCEYCDKRFRMKDNLMKHVRRVHGKTTETAEYEAGFRPVAAFSQSKASSFATESGLFRCDRCRMTFNRTSLLVTHMRYCLKQRN